MLTAGGLEDVRMAWKLFRVIGQDTAYACVPAPSYNAPRCLAVKTIPKDQHFDFQSSLATQLAGPRIGPDLPEGRAVAGPDPSGTSPDLGGPRLYYQH